MVATQRVSQDTWQKVFLETPDFTETLAYPKLVMEAERPFDLSGQALSADRFARMRSQAAGYTLLWACERVSAKTEETLFALAQERKVLEQMYCMQSGYPINWIEGVESEKRAVLHTATRDLFDNANPNPKAQEVRTASLAEHQKLRAFLIDLEAEKRFSEMIFVGIGGSELGPRALYESLAFYYKPHRKVHFIGNVDPDDVAIALSNTDLAHTLVVVISKSGTTEETATNEAFLRDYFNHKGLVPKEHFVAVTCPGTPMDDNTRYRACFYLWESIGGRYSASSLVGGLLLSFTCGYECYYEFLRGAHDMDQVALKDNPRENLPLIGALLGVWNRNFLGYPTVAVIPYSRLLNRFPAHLQQCDMESNGKRVNRKGQPVTFQTGPIVWGEPGTNAQHSFFQLLHQGTAIVPLELIGFARSQGKLDFEWHDTTSQEKLLANLMAQAIALATGQKNANPNKSFPGNRPSSLLLAKQLTPYSLGALLAYYEHKIAFQGFLWGINSFDQEGVQLGKVLASKFLKHYSARRTGKPAEPFDLARALLPLFADALDTV
jgi:glucose-6-phosphate isomerase